jgi:predicted amidophosphoribosyltransferase
MLSQYSLFTFEDAVLTPCAHTFCRKCIKKVSTNNCPLCNAQFTHDQLNTAFNVQAIANEFKKMRHEFEEQYNVNLSQVPIHNLSHEDSLEQIAPRQPTIPCKSFRCILVIIPG